MEEKKKGKGSLIVIILLIIVILGLVGYICYDKGIILKSEPKKVENNSTKEAKKEEKQPVITNYAVTDEKVSKLISRLLAGSLDDSCKTLEVYANDKRIEATDIPILKAYRIAESVFYDSGKQSISLDEFTKVVQKYLGKDYRFEPKDKMGLNSCMLYFYDANSKTFNKQETACGGTCGPTTDYKLVKAIDTDGILELDVKVIFASLDEGKDGYYSDYAKTNKIGTFEDNRDSLYEKGSDYKFTFKLEDGNYVFVSSSPVK